MAMILLILGMCVTRAILPFFINWILQYLNMESATEVLLRRKEREIRLILDGLSIVDEFAKYAKLERQLCKLQQELTEAYNRRWSYHIKKKLSINYGVKLFYGFILVLIIWNYKFTPAIVLPTQWTSPFSFVMSWPTGVEGGISISMWLLMVETAIRIVSSKIVS